MWPNLYPKRMSAFWSNSKFVSCSLDAFCTEGLPVPFCFLQCFGEPKWKTQGVCCATKEKEWCHPDVKRVEWCHLPGALKCQLWQWHAPSCRSENRRVWKLVVLLWTLFRLVHSWQITEFCPRVFKCEIPFTSSPYPAKIHWDTCKVGWYFFVFTRLSFASDFFDFVIACREWWKWPFASWLQLKDWGIGSYRLGKGCRTLTRTKRLLLLVPSSCFTEQSWTSHASGSHQLRIFRETAAQMRSLFLRLGQDFWPGLGSFPLCICGSYLSRQ